MNTDRLVTILTRGLNALGILNSPVEIRDAGTDQPEIHLGGSYSLIPCEIPRPSFSLLPSAERRTPSAELAWQLYRTVGYPGTREDPPDVELVPEGDPHGNLWAAATALLLAHLGERLEDLELAEGLAGEWEETFREKFPFPLADAGGEQAGALETVAALQDRLRAAAAAQAELWAAAGACTLCGAPGGHPICDACCLRSDEAYDAARERRGR